MCNSIDNHPGIIDQNVYPGKGVGQTLSTGTNTWLTGKVKLMQMHLQDFENRSFVVSFNRKILWLFVRSKTSNLGFGSSFNLIFGCLSFFKIPGNGDNNDGNDNTTIYNDNDNLQRMCTSAPLKARSNAVSFPG